MDLRGDFDFKKLRPLRDRVLVAIDPIHEARSLSGLLILPGNRLRAGAEAREAITGRVLAAGPGRMVGERFVPTSARVGSHVAINPQTGCEIRSFEWKGYVVAMWDDEVLAEIGAPS